MNIASKLAAASALALIVSASSAFAQGALVGVESLDDRIDDIQEDAQTELEKGDDSQRFGTAQYAQGWQGSLAASFAGTTGNTDTADLSVGARLRYGAGVWNHTLGFAIEYGEDNGVKSKEEIFATYDANRYFNDKFYVFGLASVRHDEFASLQNDAFLGFGPGVRLINNEKVAWRVQAGPGVRYTEDQAGNNNTEAAGIASSRLYYKISDRVFLSNDTDLLYSDVGALATNDIGINFQMSDNLSTRLGYRTEYNSDPLPGIEEFDNALSAAVVFGF